MSQSQEAAGAAGAGAHIADAAARPLWRKAPVAAIALPQRAVMTTLGVFIAPYLAGQMGVALAVVGATFGLVRLLDVPFDPLCGMMIDRTRTRFGRYRVWMALGAPVLMLALYMIIHARAGVTQPYLIIWLLVLYMGLSIWELSLSAWASSLAKDYHDRSRLFGVIQAVGVTGSSLILLIPVIFEHTGRGDAGIVHAMGWSEIVAIPIACAVAVLLTPERPSAPSAKSAFRLRDYWEIIRQPNMIRIILADLFFTLGPGWVGATLLFYITRGKGLTTGDFGLLLLLYTFIGVFGAPFMARVAQKISKPRAVMICAAGFATTIACWPLVPQHSFAGCLAQMLPSGIFGSGFTLLIRAMTGDVADQVRLEQGKERAALMYALTSLTTKISGALSITITYFLLDEVGFNAKGANTAEALSGLQLITVAGPAVLCGFGALSLLGYSLTPARHAEIRRQLDERDRLAENTA